MIYFVIITVAFVGVILMNEFGWANLTGSIRNNVVFETRNKEYGAYEIRQKYSNRLIVAFLGSLAFITLAAFSPKFFPHTPKPTTEEKLNGPAIDVKEMVNEKKEEPKKEEIRENKVEKQQPAPKHPDVSTFANTTPKPTDKKQELDTLNKPDPNAIASNVNHKGDSTATATLPPGIIPKGTGGGTGECLDCPPPGIPTPAEVTEQAEFNYQKFFRDNLRIPDEVYNINKSEVKVYVGFVLDEEGNVTNVSIKKGVIPELDNEVKRVASIMPKWKPAKFNEHNVKVRMSIPIRITLR